MNVTDDPGVYQVASLTSAVNQAKPSIQIDLLSQLALHRIPSPVIRSVYTTYDQYQGSIWSVLSDCVVSPLSGTKVIGVADAGYSLGPIGPI